jgi:hypothetical protein
MRGTMPISKIRAPTKTAQSWICSTFLLKSVCVARATVASIASRITYPPTRWYLYSFLALASPPYSCGTKYCVIPTTACRAVRMYVIRPRMACGDWKCVPLWLILLYSITTSPAMAVRRAMSFSAACAYVPSFFCFAVWVGWTTRIPWMKKRSAAELSSCKDVG